MNRWLARLSFSFFIVAVVLLWQWYKLSQHSGPRDSWRLSLYLIGAAAAAVLGLAGVRARHRS
jgi:hypothetical protein